MKKFSFNNSFVRIFYFLIAVFPFLFYLVLKNLLDFNFNFTIGIALFFLFCLFYFFVVLKFNFFDWDLFIVKHEKFVFKKFSELNEVAINRPFQIKSIPFITRLFYTFRIKFDDGQEYYFKYRAMRFSFFSTIDEYAKEVGKEIMAAIKN